MLSEGVSKVINDLDELKEYNLSSLDVDKVLADDLLSPVFHNLRQFSFFARSSLLLIDFGIVFLIRSHLRASDNVLISITSLGFLGKASGLGFLDVGNSLSLSLLLSSLFCVDRNEERVGLDVSVELSIVEFVRKSIALRVVLLNYLDEVFSLELLLI